jgi:hypothetical protein
MRIRHVLALLALVLLAGAGRAADREIKGKLVEVDVDDKSVTVETDQGKKIEFSIGAASKVYDHKGVSNFGFKDARLKPGASVKVVLPEGKSKTIKELHYLAAATVESDKPSSKTKVTSKYSPPAKDSSSKESPSKDSSSKKSTKDEPTTTKSGSEKDLPEAKLLKIDKEKRMIQVEMVEGGKKVQYTIGKDVEFVGPRGGVSDEEFDDDRFAVGNIIKLEMDGRQVSKIHLPYRHRKPKDKN